jgi:flagellar protein FlaG
MDINEIASRANAAFSPQKPTGRAAASFSPQNPGSLESGQTIASRTDRQHEAAASSSVVQTQSVQVSDASADPSARNSPTPDDLQAVVEKIQKFVSEAASDIKFSIDEDSGRTVVKVIDRETQDVIRQIPSQEMLDLAKALDKLQGLLLKQKA